ncbi:hypothetical protein JZX87_20450 [Agrobacterium sp. Ap1]|uniref:hypothetical protein n=1 Tax=Agrobacterium sp. Ap1 TaxID=2815337 RepID=UPI001A8EB7CF|nr:hypothetical protein [Agrobacterium sp. Ap1]MBO0143541.1 hypothetical protein [Agrobacterium sp. Ap1]
MPQLKDIHPELTGSSTSSTTFGRSMESKSQIADSAPPKFVGEALNIYRLEPIASADDPAWANKPGHGVVVVAARTAGDARIVAAERELDFMEIDAAPADDVSTRTASAFRDEKFYTVVEIEHGRCDLVRGVIEGDIRMDVIKPLCM